MDKIISRTSLCGAHFRLGYQNQLQNVLKKIFYVGYKYPGLAVGIRCILTILLWVPDFNLQILSCYEPSRGAAIYDAPHKSPVWKTSGQVEYSAPAEVADRVDWLGFTG